MNNIEERVLRTYLRKKILKELNNKTFSEIEARNKENFIRDHIKVLLEEVGTVQGRSTGINVLANVLKQIIPIVKQAYELLTTSDEQRKSFRAHIIQNSINTLMKVDVLSPNTDGEDLTEPVNPELDQEPELPEEMPQETTPEQDFEVDSDEEDIVGGIEDEEQSLQEAASVVVDPDNNVPNVDESDERFIDIDNSQKKIDDKGKPKADKIEFVDIQGMDQTGKELAQKTMAKIQKQIAEAYGMLSHIEDRNQFAEYLVANLKLYFDQFDQESNPAIPEPQSDQYDQIKSRTQELSGMNENIVFAKLMKAIVWIV